MPLLIALLIISLFSAIVVTVASNHGQIVAIEAQLERRTLNRYTTVDAQRDQGLLLSRFASVEERISFLERHSSCR